MYTCVQINNTEKFAPLSPKQFPLIYEKINMTMPEKFKNTFKNTLKIHFKNKRKKFVFKYALKENY